MANGTITASGLLFGIILAVGIIIGAIIIGAIIITIVIHYIYHDNKDKILKATKLWAIIYSVIIGIILIFVIIPPGFRKRLALIPKDITKFYGTFDFYATLILLSIIIFAWGIVHLIRLIIIRPKWIAIKYKERGVKAEVTIDNKYKYAGNSGQYTSRTAVYEKADRSNYYYIAGGLALGVIVAFAYLYLK